MLDGVYLSEDPTAIVALGILEDERTEILDVKIGSSEDTQVASDLITGLKERGLRSPAKRFFAINDGSEALEKGLLRHDPKAIIKRCLVHNESKLHSYPSQVELFLEGFLAWADRLTDFSPTLS